MWDIHLDPINKASAVLISKRVEDFSKEDEDKLISLHGDLSKNLQEIDRAILSIEQQIKARSGPSKWKAAAEYNHRKYRLAKHSIIEHIRASSGVIAAIAKGNSAKIEAEKNRIAKANREARRLKSEELQKAQAIKAQEKVKRQKERASEGVVFSRAFMRHAKKELGLDIYSAWIAEVTRTLEEK